jgi:hypothetical protein
MCVEKRSPKSWAGGHFPGIALATFFPTIAHALYLLIPIRAFFHIPLSSSTKSSKGDLKCSIPNRPMQVQGCEEETRAPAQTSAFSSNEGRLSEQKDSASSLNYGPGLLLQQSTLRDRQITANDRLFEQPMPRISAYDHFGEATPSGCSFYLWLVGVVHSASVHYFHSHECIPSTSFADY